MRTVRVRAGDGRVVPLPSALAIDTGLTVLTPETSAEVLYNRFTRGRLAAGDFVLADEAAAPAPKGSSPMRMGRDMPLPAPPPEDEEA